MELATKKTVPMMVAQSEGRFTLKEVASKACRHIDIGAAVMPSLLFDENAKNGYQLVTPDMLSESAESGETKYSRTLRSEFNAVVIEHHLKWSPLCETLPGPLTPYQPNGNGSIDRLGRYDFYHTDLIVEYCLKHNLKIKGHVLLWHVTSPLKLLEDMSPDKLRDCIRQHIFTVMGHYRGKIKVWDVVNEALAPDGTLANNLFLQKLGPLYIDDAFRWAHEADPTAFLIYNDNKVEGCGLLPAERSRKADAFYKLLKGMVGRGVPVHGAGMQAHFNAAGVGWNRCPTPCSVKAQIHRLGGLGLKVNISELDVRISKLVKPPPGCTPDVTGETDIVKLRHLAQRQIYHDILAAALTEPAFDGIWLWGVTDKHSWVTDFYYNDEPLLFDDACEPKSHCYDAVRDALLTLGPGGAIGGNVLQDSDFDSEGQHWGYEWMAPPENYEETATANIAAAQKKVQGDDTPDWLLPPK
jgi:endo-1,4-beta-xylanase